MSTSIHLKLVQLRCALFSNINSQVNGPLQCERFSRAADVFVPKLDGTTARPAGRRAAGRNNRHLGADTRLDPPVKCVRATLEVDRKIETIPEQPKQIPWTISP